MLVLFFFVLTSHPLKAKLDSDVISFINPFPPVKGEATLPLRHAKAPARCPGSVMCYSLLFALSHKTLEFALSWLLSPESIAISVVFVSGHASRNVLLSLSLLLSFKEIMNENFLFFLFLLKLFRAKGKNSKLSALPLRKLLDFFIHEKTFHTCYRSHKHQQDHQWNSF
jgi:hypothetical protein